MFDKAEQTMARAAADTLRTDEERAQAFYNLGNAQFLQKKYKEALESYRRSLLLDPADMEAKYNYAYTKKLLDENENQNSENNNNQQQEQEQDKNQQEQSRDTNQEQQDNNEEERDGQQDPSESDQNDKNNNEGQEQPVPAGISEQEQQQMLDAIQAQEDKTQEKLKEKQFVLGVIVRGGKNW